MRLGGAAAPLLLSCCRLALLGSRGVQDCQPYNFNTFYSAWLALVQITVGNNWNSIMCVREGATRRGFHGRRSA